MAKTKSKKNELAPSKPLSREVTLRFMTVSGELIMVNRFHGGPYKTRTAFCASIDMAAQQFNAYEAGQNVSVEHLVKICERHGVSGHWLLTGDGPQYHMAEIATRMQHVEERLSHIEINMGLNSVVKKKK